MECLTLTLVRLDFGEGNSGVLPIISHSTPRTFGFRGTLLSPVLQGIKGLLLIFGLPYVIVSFRFLDTVLRVLPPRSFPFLRPAPVYRVVVLDFLKLFNSLS